MRKVLTATAAFTAAVGVFVLVTLPSAPITTLNPPDPDVASRTIAGAYHVHSSASDGSDGHDAIAAAAARAGLRFVVFTDHGDGTRTPEAPRYVDGVLCIDGVEISTNEGHYVALDMRPSPYPLGGEAAAVVEDVRRLGGFGIAAHPQSLKEDLRWRNWSAPVDGLEWLNADSEWRDESTASLLRVPLYYAFRPGAALALLLDRPVPTLERWDALTSVRPAVGLAAHDAHGGVMWNEGANGRPRFSGVPSYVAMFRTLSLRAVLPSPLTGAAPADGRMVMDAIRRGRVFAVIDAVAAPAWLDFRADRGDTHAIMGDALLFEPDVELSVRASMPPDGLLIIICGGSRSGESVTGQLTLRVPAPGACRVEVLAPGAPGDPPVPWLTGNPIYLLPAIAEPVGSEPLVEIARTLDEVDWLLEKDPESSATIGRAGAGFVLDYHLRAGERVSQYVAAVAGLRAPLPPFERLLFTASSGAPMRVSVQLRFDGGERWVHSVYVEPDSRRVSLELTDLVPADRTSSQPPDFRQASSLLFVVDLTNAVPGAAGTLHVSDVAFGRPVGRPAGR